MDSNKDLEIILSLTVVFSLIIFFTKISYFYLTVPVMLLFIGLASNKIARATVVILKTVLNFVIQLLTKILLTIFFFMVLLPILVFEGIFQKGNSRNTPKAAI